MHLWVFCCGALVKRQAIAGTVELSHWAPARQQCTANLVGPAKTCKWTLASSDSICYSVVRHACCAYRSVACKLQPQDRQSAIAQVHVAALHLAACLGIIQIQAVAFADTLIDEGFGAFGENWF